MGFVRVTDVDRAEVGVGVNRGRGDAELAAGAHDAYGDLAAIGDQNLGKQLSLHQI
jgi:hypothetical protein